MTKQERITMYKNFLATEGYTPYIDDDGDVHFKYEGRNYFIWIDQNDEEFFKVSFPKFWAIKNAEDRQKVIDAALYVTKNVKAVKVVIVENDVWANVEMFLSPAEMFKNILLRSLTELHSS